jgi:hypothetical protein
MESYLDILLYVKVVSDPFVVVMNNKISDWDIPYRHAMLDSTEIKIY